MPYDKALQAFFIRCRIKILHQPLIIALSKGCFRIFIIDSFHFNFALFIIMQCLVTKPYKLFFIRCRIKILHQPLLHLLAAFIKLFKFYRYFWEAVRQSKFFYYHMLMTYFYLMLHRPITLLLLLFRQKLGFLKSNTVSNVNKLCQ